MGTLEYAEKLYMSLSKDNLDLRMEINDLKAVIANLEDELKYYQLTGE